MATRSKEIMKDCVKQVCDYLKVDENLFFCGIQESRIREARKYFCYLSISQGVEAAHVSRYLGYTETRTSSHLANEIKNYIQDYQNSQCTRDIEKLSELVELTAPTK